MVEATTPPNPADSSQVRTVPDPTLLTIDALRREIAMLENLVDTRIGAREELEQERFLRVDALMAKAEEQRREQKDDTKEAVDAALDSQKEATSKMEKSISDQISSLRANFETEVRSLRGSLDDLKEGLTRLQSVKQGQADQRIEARQSTAAIWAAVAVLATLFVAGFSVFVFFAGGGM